MSLSRLARMYGPGLIADMEDAGQIVVDRTDRHFVTLGDRYLGDIVRNWLSVERRLELRDKVPGHQEHELGEADRRGPARLRGVDARLPRPAGPRPRAGGRAGRRQALRPEVRAQMRRQPRVPPTRNGPEGQLQKSAAYLQLGLPLQAMSALDDVSEEQTRALGCEAFAELIAAKADCMAWLEDRSRQSSRTGAAGPAAAAGAQP